MGRGLCDAIRLHDLRSLRPVPGSGIGARAVSDPLVVVDNGMAAARFVDELAKVALGRYAVAVIGEEPRLAYNRVLLSSVLAGETASPHHHLKPASWGGCPGAP